MKMLRFVTMLLAALCIGVVSGSSITAAVTVAQYHVHDFIFRGQVTGNPFDADMVGVFTGPGGLRLEIPGFYDGNNTWIVRFAPTRVGQWSLRTLSSIPALNGQAETA